MLPIRATAVPLAEGFSNMVTTVSRGMIAVVCIQGAWCKTPVPADSCKTNRPG
jgi:hypothetical protein